MKWFKKEKVPLIKFVVEVDDDTGDVNMSLETDPNAKDVMPGILAGFFVTLCSEGFAPEIADVVLQDVGPVKFIEYIERLGEELIIKEQLSMELDMLDEIESLEKSGEEMPIVEPVAVSFGKGANNESM